MAKTVAILGSGNMGTAMAQVAASNGHRVFLWTIEPSTYSDLKNNRRNSKYIGDIPLNEAIRPTLDLGEAVTEAELIIICVPSQAVRRVIKQTAAHLAAGQLLLNTAKGLEEGSRLSMSAVISEELETSHHGSIATMGGPAIARELASGLPTAVAVAAGDIEIARQTRRALENNYFKVETTIDVRGVELGATLKNVYAIPLGMADGINLGANTKAIIGTIGFNEMERVACALGAQSQTIRGLAGLGDLLTTGYSPLSRNRTLGEHLGSNSGWQQYLETHTVEGIAATHTVKELIAGLGLETPLLDMMYSILFQGAKPDETLRSFLARYAFS